jgi:hypothetical protein
VSVFTTQELTCPSCEKPVSFAVVESVNADRRPDLREAILDGSFQRDKCGQCGESFRAPPQMVYMDMKLRLWALTRPAETVAELAATEAKAREMFDLAFGSSASPLAREIGADLRARVVFGWAALREKILCAREGLDDLELELTKLAAMRYSQELPADLNLELRLDRVEEADLVLSWIAPGEEEFVLGVRVPRALYDEIAANRMEWQPLRDQIAVGPYVEVRRLFTSVAEVRTV